MFAPVLTFALAFAAPAPEPPALPKGPAPKVMVLNVDKDGRLYVEAPVTEIKAVPRAYTREQNGRQVTETGCGLDAITEQRHVSLDDDGVQVFGPDGKQVDPKRLSKQAVPAPVLVSADGKEVDPFYLWLAKPGTLVIVATKLAALPPKP